MDIYDEVFFAKYDKPQYIIPIVDGGSITVEYLGEAPDVAYNETEEIMGLTEVGIGDEWSSLSEDSPLTPRYVNLDRYIDPSLFYVNPDYEQVVKPTKTKDHSILRLAHLQGNDYYASVDIPVGDTRNDPGRAFIRIVSEEEAARMMEAIERGHPVRRIGKTLDDPVDRSDIWEPRVRHVDKAELERTYGLQISVQSSLIEEPYALEMIDQVLGTFPEGLIREVTDYYRKKGKTSRIRFVDRMTHLSGSFSDSGSQMLIELYPGTTGSFESWAVAHEMGHYLQRFLNDRHGAAKLRQEWQALNGGIAYGTEWTDGDEDVFVRDYGKTSFNEDVATVFEWLARYNNAELRRQYAGGTDKPILKKIDLLNRALDEASAKVDGLSGVWGTLYPQQPSRYAVSAVEKARASGVIPDSNF